MSSLELHLEKISSLGSGARSTGPFVTARHDEVTELPGPLSQAVCASPSGDEGDEMGFGVSGSDWRFRSE